MTKSRRRGCSWEQAYPCPLTNERPKNCELSRPPFHPIKSSSILYQNHSHRPASGADLSISCSVFALYFTALISHLSSLWSAAKLIYELSCPSFPGMYCLDCMGLSFRHCRCLGSRVLYVHDAVWITASS